MLQTHVSKKRNKPTFSSLSRLSAWIYSWLHPQKVGVSISPSQLQFVLILEHLMHRNRATETLEERGEHGVVLKELCLHKHRTFQFKPLFQFRCMGCLVYKRTRQVVGCRACSWEVCADCRENLFYFFDRVSTNYDFIQAIRHMASESAIKQTFKWAKHMQGMRREVMEWLQTALLPDTVIFTLCWAQLNRNKKNLKCHLALFPVDLYCLVGKMLGPNASLSLLSTS